MKQDGPTVSVVVPCRNERRHIEACLRSILLQDVPGGNLEVIVADGMSSDGTRDVLSRLAAMDPRVRVVDNVTGMTAHGMNVGIRAARGRLIAIFGAHTEYARDYLRTCVEILEQRPEVCCAGGPIVSCGSGVFGRGVAAAMSHPIGVGNAKHRFPDYEGYAEGACFPVFRREVFDSVGLYDEALIRNQDDDLNFRVARSGGKVFISPRARCAYRVREGGAALFRQYFDYGYWRVAVLRKHRVPASMRQLVPVVFFLATAALGMIGLALPGQWKVLGLMLPAAYGAVLGAGGMAVAARDGIAAGLLFPVAAAIMHLAYAAGFAWGMVGGAGRIPSVSERGGASRETAIR